MTEWEMSCSVCGVRSEKYRRTVLAGIRFENLEGNPIVCERCVFKALTGKDRAWMSHVKESLEGLASE